MQPTLRSLDMSISKLTIAHDHTQTDTSRITPPAMMECMDDALATPQTAPISSADRAAVNAVVLTGENSTARPCTNGEVLRLHCLDRSAQLAPGFAAPS